MCTEGFHGEFGGGHSLNQLGVGFLFWPRYHEELAVLAPHSVGTAVFVCQLLRYTNGVR